MARATEAHGVVNQHNCPLSIMSLINSRTSRNLSLQGVAVKGRCHLVKEDNQISEAGKSNNGHGCFDHRIKACREASFWSKSYTVQKAFRSPAMWFLSYYAPEFDRPQNRFLQERIQNGKRHSKFLKDHSDFLLMNHAIITKILYCQKPVRYIHIYNCHKSQRAENTSSFGNGSLPCWCVLGKVYWYSTTQWNPGYNTMITPSLKQADIFKEKRCFLWNLRLSLKVPRKRIFQTVPLFKMLLKSCPSYSSNWF